MDEQEHRKSEIEHVNECGGLRLWLRDTSRKKASAHVTRSGQNKEEAKVVDKITVQYSTE